METLEELEFDTIEEVLEFNVKERAFRNGWEATYTLADQYFADFQQKHLELLNHVNADMKNDCVWIDNPDWESKFDESCNLMSMMLGISRLKMFIATPIYEDNDIDLLDSEQEAYETGKHKAYDAMLDIWHKLCNEEIIGNEQKLYMLGAWNLLNRISALTGYQFDCNAMMPCELL